MRLWLIFVFFVAVLAVKGNSNVTRQQRVVSTLCFESGEMKGKFVKKSASVSLSIPITVSPRQQQILGCLPAANLHQLTYDTFPRKQIQHTVIKLSDFVRKFFASLIQEHLSKHSRQGNANEYFDKLLINVRQYLATNYDPLEQYDLTSELKSIHLEGLSTIARTGSSSVHGKDDDLILDSHLGFHKFKARANFEKHLWWFFWLCGICSADIRGIDLYLRVRAKFLDDRLKLHLESIDIVDWGHMSSSFQGTNWMGTILTGITYLFPSIVEGWLKNNIPSMLFDGVRDALSSVTFTWSDFDWPSVRSQQMLLNVHKNKREIVH